jgi:hypothetical protein
MDPRRQLPLPSGLGSKAPRGYADRPQRRHPRHGWRLHTRRVLVWLAVSSKASSALGTCGQSRRLVERPVRRSSASAQRAIRLGAQRGESRACKRAPRSHPPRVGHRLANRADDLHDTCRSRVPSLSRERSWFVHTSTNPSSGVSKLPHRMSLKASRFRPPRCAWDKDAADFVIEAVDGPEVLTIDFVGHHGDERTRREDHHLRQRAGVTPDGRG